MAQDVLDRVLNSPSLPSLPTIALEVIELVQQRDVNIKQIAETISHDPALASQILKTVNSSFYGQAYSISTISHALVVLGLNSVKTLALGFSLVGNLSTLRTEGFDAMLFWKRSLYSATAGRWCAREKGLAQQEEVFLAGLLQNLGQMAMSRTLGADYNKLVGESEGDPQKLLELEVEAFGIDHKQMGGKLAEHWKLPPVLATPIQFASHPDDAPAEIQNLVRMVHLGGLISDIFVVDPENENCEELTSKCLALAQEKTAEWLNLEEKDMERLMTAIHEDTVEMGKLFELQTGTLHDPGEILSRANQAMMMVSLQAAQKTSVLEEANQNLLHKTRTDPLTGVANRGYFDETAKDKFDMSRASGEPLSVFFLDTDHFKQFNDNYGHQVGDYVLIEKAKCIKNALPESGFLGRYGGEEFSVLLSNTDRVTASRIAENIRRAIENLELKTEEGEQLHITTSIGVATYDGTYFEKVEQLINAADQGVYAAKAAGRNCVRVYAPRVKKSA